MNTPVLSLPYPTSVDTADVPRDVKALAERTEASLAVPVVSVLPTTGLYDGRTVDYLHAQEPGVNDPAGTGAWRLRYDASIADAYKWRFVGGTDYAVRGVDWAAPDVTTLQFDPDLFYAVPLAGWWDGFPDVSGTITRPTAGDYVQSSLAAYDGTTPGNSFSGDTGLADRSLLIVPSGRLELQPGGVLRVTYEIVHGQAGNRVDFETLSKRLLVRPYRVG
jgi:hypothetical protein